MTRQQVKDYCAVSTPFEESEISDAILDQVIMKSLMTLNRHNPKIIRGNNSLMERPEYKCRNIRPLRAYYDQYDHSNPYSLSTVEVLKAGGAQGFFIYYAIDWLLEDVDENLPLETVVNTNAKFFFYELLSTYTYLYCSNRRRSATMSELPFDLHGDEFHNEGKEKLDQLIKDMTVAFMNAI